MTFICSVIHPPPEFLVHSSVFTDRLRHCHCCAKMRQRPCSNSQDRLKLLCLCCMFCCRIEPLSCLLWTVLHTNIPFKPVFSVMSVYSLCVYINRKIGFQILVLYFTLLSQLAHALYLPSAPFVFVFTHLSLYLHVSFWLNHLDNLGKQNSCHGNRCRRAGHPVLPLSWQQVHIPCMSTKHQHCLYLSCCFYYGE